jgi:hypothetical protein
MKHLIPETGDILKHIPSEHRYAVTRITWNKTKDDYQITLDGGWRGVDSLPMSQLDKTRWEIVTPEHMNFMQ